MENNTTIELLTPVHLIDSSIKVKCKIYAELKDSERFINSSIGDFNSWVAITLEKILLSEFFSLSYKDVILEIEVAEKRILNALKFETEKIGYAIKQYHLIPEIEELRLLTVGLNFKENQEFQTREHGIKINIAIIISGNIESFSSIPSKYLSPNLNLEEIIQHSIINHLRDEIHILPSEKLFFNFYSNENGRISISSQLTESLKLLLIKEFGFAKQSLVIHLKLLQNEITQLLNKLTQRNPSVTIGILPNNISSLSEKVDFILKYSITGIAKHGWQTFALKSKNSRDEFVEELNSVLDSEVKAFFSTISDLPLVSKSPTDFAKIRFFIEDRVLKKTGEFFGLNLQLISLRRLQTTSEKTYLELNEFSESLRNNQLKKLLIEEKKRELSHQFREDLDKIQELLKSFDEIKSKIDFIKDKYVDDIFKEDSTTKEPNDDGKIEYIVPSEMDIYQKNKCVVKIFNSFILGKIKEESVNEEKINVKNIKVSDLMKVELLNDLSSDCFEIISLSDTEQLIRNNNYTEWVFIVIPKKVGVHEIVLRASIIEDYAQFKNKSQNVFLAECKVKVKGNQSNIFDEIRLHISKNNIDKAISSLISQSKSTDYHNDIILQSNKFNEILRKQRNHLLSNEDVSLLNARVVNALLQITGELERLNK